MTETTARGGRNGNRFVDKVVRRSGRKELRLRTYLSGGAVVGEKLYISEPSSQGGEDRTWLDSVAAAARAIDTWSSTNEDWRLTPSGSRQPSWQFPRS